jgi:hypothetical protein
VRKSISITSILLLLLTQQSFAQAVTVQFTLTSGQSSLNVPSGGLSNVTFSVTLNKEANATVSGVLKVYAQGNGASAHAIFTSSSINDNNFTGTSPPTYGLSGSFNITQSDLESVSGKVFAQFEDSGGLNYVSNKFDATIPVGSITKNTIATSGSTSFVNSGNPTPIKGSTPSGGNGTYSYQWQSSTTNATTGFSNITVNGTLIDYDPPVITQTTYYRRNVSSGSLTSTSNPVTIQIKAAGSPPSPPVTVPSPSTNLTLTGSLYVRATNGMVLGSTPNSGGNGIGYIGGNSNGLTLRGGGYGSDMPAPGGDIRLAAGVSESFEGGDVIMNTGAGANGNNGYIFLDAGAKSPVGIGYSTYSAVQSKLDVNGPIRSTSFVLLSDRNLKTDIRTLQESLSMVTALHGVRYKFKQNEGLSLPKGPQLGFLAQEVEAVAPEAVTTDSNGLKGVDYSKIIPILVEAIKERQEQIEVLRTELSSLEAATKNPRHHRNFFSAARQYKKRHYHSV